MSRKKYIILGTVVLLVVIAGLGLFFGLMNKNTEYRDMGKISSIKYSIGKEEYELIKDEESWYWKDRDDLSLDEELVKSQVKVVSEELGIVKIEEKGSFKKYGLDDTEYSLTLKDSRGRKITIHIGDMMSEDTYFVKIGNQKGIYTASWEIMQVIDSLSAQRTRSEQMEMPEK